MDQITLKWMPGSSQSAAANSGSGESADAISGQTADSGSGQSANATSAGNETPKREEDNAIEKPSLGDIFKNSRIYLPNENEMARNAKMFTDKKVSQKATLTTLDLSNGQPKGAIMFMEGLKDDTTKEDIKAALMDQFDVEADFDFVFYKFKKGLYEKYAVKKGHYARFLEKNLAINLAARITEKLGGTEAGSKLNIKKVDLDFRVLEGQEETNYLREERKRLRKIRDFNAPWWNTDFHNLRKKVEAAKRKWKGTKANPNASPDEIREKYDAYKSVQKDYNYKIRKSKRAFNGPREPGLAVKKSSVEDKIDRGHFTLM